MKIEIEIPEDHYNKLDLICKLNRIKINEKITQILIEEIDSIEIDNF
ncbi:MAG: hypothetical protein ACP6IY_11065 [Promethearchaeia archaeon]